jgi:uncharacterized protein (TIGR00369 family)
MGELKPSDADYERRVRESFARQRVMTLFGARLERVAPGEVDLVLPYREDLTQQDGYVHAGVVTAVADSACGYAAYTLMPAGSNVLAVEFKVNLLRPAAGPEFVAEARVVKAGRTLTVTRCDVHARGGAGAKLVATMLATMIRRP